MKARLIRKGLRRSLLLLLALLFLLEAWLWEFGGRWLGRVIAWLPLEQTKRRIQSFVEPLSPWATVPVFLVPILFITPFNFVAGWLFVQGKFMLGLFTILMQKMLGVAALSFMFNACRPKLMQLRLVRLLYEVLAGWYCAARRLTLPYREIAKRWAGIARRKLVLHRRGMMQIARRSVRRGRREK
jgi:hypothetical protein